MANLYGKPQGFLEDYSGIAALGAGFEGALKGLQAANEQKYKKMEFEAKMKADRDKSAREAEELAIKRHKESPEYQRRQEKLELAKTGQEPEYDAQGNFVGAKYRDDYKEIQRTKAEADPFGIKRINAENAAKPRDTELTAAGYARRMEGAESKYKNLMATGFDPTTVGAQAQMSFGGPLEAIKDNKVKLYQQMVSDFASAVLRKESGAAISKQEYSDVNKMYFPQAGDSPDVLAAKAASRAQSFENFKAQAGKAFDKTPRVMVPSLSQPSKKSKGLVSNGLVSDGLVTKSSGPKVGEVDGGYRFKGGDPADQKNWEKVK